MLIARAQEEYKDAVQRLESGHVGVIPSEEVALAQQRDKIRGLLTARSVIERDMVRLEMKLEQYSRESTERSGILRQLDELERTGRELQE